MVWSELTDFSTKLQSEKDPAHDFTHTERVIKLCKVMASPEMDISIVMEAAHFHGLLHEETNIRNFLKSLGYEDSHINIHIFGMRLTR